MAISQMTDNVEVIQTLSDTPNDTLSAQQLKEKFDLGGRYLKAFINGTIVPAINSILSSISTMATSIGNLESKFDSSGYIKVSDIADGSITGTKLADGAVGSAKIGASAITTAKVADGNINAAKLAKVLGVTVVALTGERESKLSELADCAVRAGDTVTYRVQELHLPIYHWLCAKLEDIFFEE